MEKGVLAERLKRKRSEVMGMLLAEYNEAREREYLRREAIEEGYDSGYNSGYDKGQAASYDSGFDKGRNEADARTLAAVCSMVQDGILTAEEASKRFGFTVGAIEQARDGEKDS